MRLSIHLLVLSLFVLVGCHSPQVEQQDSPAFIGKWYHQGFEIDGESVSDDNASSPFYEFEAGGEMYAYKSPDAPVSDERGWFEVVGPNQLRVIGDGDGGEENGIADEGEVASALLMQWAIEGETMRMSAKMGDQTMTIVFRRGWPETTSDR